MNKNSDMQYIYENILNKLIKIFEIVATNFEIDDTVGIICTIDEKIYIYTIEIINDIFNPDTWESMSRLYEYAFLHNIKSARLILVVNKHLSDYYTQFLETDRGIYVISVQDEVIDASPKTRDELSFLWQK